MSRRAVFDTNVLPVRGGISSALWLSIQRLCEAAGIAIAIPDVVVNESCNMRREAYSEASAALLHAIRQVSKLTDLNPIYVPGLDEVVSAWKAELQEIFEILPVHGADSTEALAREALRRRPAREGKGARDSAIWLTTLRLMNDHDEVLFVTRNTSDFCDSTGALHPALVEDVADRGENFRFFTSLDEFIGHIATVIDPPELDGPAVADATRYQLRDLAFAQLIEDQSSEHGADSLDAELAVLGELHVLRSYGLNDQGLVLTKTTATIPLGDPRDANDLALEALIWVDVDLVSGEILGCDVVDGTLAT